MSRVQLALNVSDLEASIAFYSTLFGVEPHKRRPGYANFAITEPALKLVLIEVPADDRGTGVTGALNHLGIEVEAVEQVEAQAGRLREAGLAAFDEKDTTCCYALQDKVWVHDPAGRAVGDLHRQGRRSCEPPAGDRVVDPARRGVRGLSLLHPIVCGYPRAGGCRVVLLTTT